MQLQEIRCTNPECGRMLGETSAEFKRICPKCGLITHVVVTSEGILKLSENGKCERVKK
jgi:phage FluMu protein Com